MPNLDLPIEGYQQPEADPNGYALPVAQPIPDNIPRVIINTGPKLKEVENDPWATGKSAIEKLFGLNGQERYQTWPEKLVRSGVTAAGDALSGDVPQWQIDPATGDVHTSPQMIERAMDMSSVAGTGGLAGADASLGSGPMLRPALKYKDKIYKAPVGGQHLDALPPELYPEFQKMAMSGEDISHYNFGFMNHKGQFLDREKALDYAVKEGLVDPTAGQYGALTSTLLADSSKPGTAIEAMGKTKYPLAKPEERWTNTLGQNDDKLTNMTPDEFLNKSRPLKVDAESRENIDAIKQHIKEGKPLDPLELHANGKEDGRHRAIAAKELGIKEIPVINFRPAEIKEPFYSALEHNVGQIKQQKMNGDAWLGTLSNKPGVKPEELQWTGLKDFLEENKGKPVTKAQIEEHLQNNKVELKEVDKGAMAPEDYAKKQFEENSPVKWDSLTAEDRKAYSDIVNRSPTVNPTKYHSYQLPGGPLSRDTEILTNKSWKRIDAIEIGDVVMTRRDEGGILEWQPVLATPKMYAEELYHFSSQSVDVRVTENHQMIAKKRRRNSEGLQRLTAKELWSKSEMLIPLTGNWTGEDEDKIFGFDANDLAELFGWYLAEGSYKHKNGNKHTIQIAQCKEYNPEKCERIEALLDRMGLPWRYYGQAYGIGTKTMNKDLAELFHEQPTSEFKFIPYFFFEQSKSVIQSLLDGLILGDGCTSVQDGRLDKTTFFTKSEQLAGDVQALILMIGKNANVRQRPSGLYCVGIKSKEWSSVDEAKFEIAPYNDFAFCVTVENHAIYVRRNGVAAFTGNSNYREKLLTLPEKQQRTYEWEYFDPKTQKSQQFKTEEEAKAAAPKGAVVLPKETSSINEPYRSSHWDEPNILAHVRMNDRVIDGKKSLHLEEIQSDWHQQGRDKGYKGSIPTDQEIKDFFKLKEGANPADYRQEMMDHSAYSGSKVPDAPFKKSWHELALKRMIREAAEKGYDRLSWTPGEAQAARYDLSKSLDTLSYKKTDQGYTIMGSKDNRNILDHFATKDELPNVVGKEMAQKIIDGEGKDKNNFKVLSGLDLKIGGEGMKGFYDQIIPKSLEKISGQKVKTVYKHEGNPTQEHRDFIDKMTNDLHDELYQDALKEGFDKNKAKSFADKHTANAEPWHLAKALNKNEELNKIFQDKLDFEKHGKQPVHYIDIPQSLKDTAMHKGFPLFAKGIPLPLMPIDHDPFEKKK